MISALVQWVKDLMFLQAVAWVIVAQFQHCGGCGVSRWLWCKPVAAAPIHPLAWERPYTAGVAIKKKKKKAIMK